MRRREFVTLLGGAVVWPFAVNAQQSLPVVGFLSSRSPEESAHLVEAFRGGLKDGGFIEGQSVSLEFRWAHGDYDHTTGRGNNGWDHSCSRLHCWCRGGRANLLHFRARKFASVRLTQSDGCRESHNPTNGAAPGCCRRQYWLFNRHWTLRRLL